AKWFLLTKGPKGDTVGTAKRPYRRVGDARCETMPNIARPSPPAATTTATATAAPRRDRAGAESSTRPEPAPSRPRLPHVASGSIEIGRAPGPRTSSASDSPGYQTEAEPGATRWCDALGRGTSWNPASTTSPTSGQKIGRVGKALWRRTS